jgi:uncharacterized protein (DUF1697 family)
MTVHISLLRGINVGGQNKIRMAELRALYESLGFEGVETYLQSGNVVFEADEADEEAVSQEIEAAIGRAWGYTVAVLMRRPADIVRIVAGNPFLTERGEDPAKLYVTFLHAGAGEIDASGLNGTEGGDDEYVVGEREVFVFCPGGRGRTKLTNIFFERKLSVPATTRNWKTVHAVYGMAEKRVG